MRHAQVLYNNQLIKRAVKNKNNTFHANCSFYSVGDSMHGTDHCFGFCNFCKPYFAYKQICGMSRVQQGYWRLARPCVRTRVKSVKLLYCHADWFPGLISASSSQNKIQSGDQEWLCAYVQDPHKYTLPTLSYTLTSLTLNCTIQDSSHQRQVAI